MPRQSYLRETKIAKVERRSKVYFDYTETPGYLRETQQIRKTEGIITIKNAVRVVQKL